jgi:hypothetical protein
LAFERRIFTVTAAVTLDRTEADLDHHLVLTSGGQDDDRRDTVSGLDAGRHGLPAPADEQLPQRRKDLLASSRVTGVAFFDFLHGQTGVAPNGIELHPILGFACLSG